jgi:SAM-dependent methyltransferase
VPLRDTLGTECTIRRRKASQEDFVIDLPRIFTIRESSHRIHNPLTAAKLAALGEALRLAPGRQVLDLASGSGEMLCTWAREHGVTGTGVDISTVFTEQARARAAELGVTDRVEFVHGDATGYVSAEPVDLAACLGATWIGSGVAGTAELLERSLRSGGTMLIGEPYWRRTPPDEETARACHASGIADFRLLPDLIVQFQDLGYDVVEMVLADQDSWDRYAAAQWLNLRRWLDQNPDDELAPDVREELSTEPARYARSTRELLGWGVFALMKR